MLQSSASETDSERKDAGHEEEMSNTHLRKFWGRTEVFMSKLTM